MRLALCICVVLVHTSIACTPTPAEFKPRNQPTNGKVVIYSYTTKTSTTMDKVEKSKDDWKKELPSDVYHVVREAGTERAFTGKYWDNHRKGIYKCVCCETDLFTSDTKFESGTGWPSFYDVISKGNVKLIKDVSLGMERTEVTCARCDAHLGHVFDDGPKPTGQRYCMNSASLTFEEKK